MTDADLPSPILHYSLETDPSPIQVDTPVDLTFTVSGLSAPDDCTVSQIWIQLPVGNDASDATNLTAVAPSESDVTISSSDKSRPNWTRTLSGVTPGLLIFTPPGGWVQFGGQGLTIEVARVRVNPVVGTAQITITEWAAPGSSPPPSPDDDPSGQKAIPAPKFPVGFHASDFAPSRAQVNRGETVTLTWIGSDNADFDIICGDQPKVPVTGYSWPSPQLYTSTVFILIASATVGDQKVELHLTTGVTVGSPEVQDFSAIPSQFYFKDTVTLDWRAVNADGVNLFTGQTDQRPLPVVPDPDNPDVLVPDPKQPSTLQPAIGASYTLQAYKGQEVSLPFPLTYTFNKIDITFTADPPTVLAGQSTTLRWVVKGAKSVSYQGGDVPDSSSSPEKPASDTTYNLTATWVNDSPVHATPVQVTVLNVPGDGYPSWLTGNFAKPGQSQLLFRSSGPRWGLGTVTGTSLRWIASDTALTGADYTPGDPIWVHDFAGSGRSRVLLCHAADQNMWLGTVAGSGLDWTKAGNNNDYHWRYDPGDPTWVGCFIDAGYSQGKPQVLFCRTVQTDNDTYQEWWLGCLIGTTFRWDWAGDTFGDSDPHYAPGDPTWAGHFAGSSQAQVLFCHTADQNWWLGAFSRGSTGATTSSWTKVCNTSNFGWFPGTHPTWVGDFTGAGKSQVLFCYTGDQNWWLGTVTGANLGWGGVGNTRGFGYDPGNHPTWIGDFTGAGKSQVLFCYTGDENWWLGTVTGSNLGWAGVGNTAHIGYDPGHDPTWVGDFTGAGKSQILFYSTGHKSWWLGTYTGPSLSWAQVA